MKVKELIETLSDFPEDAEVRLMIQPSWPFEHELAGVTCKSEMAELEEDEEDVPETDEEIVYIVEGTQLGYGSSAAWEAI